MRVSTQVKLDEPFVRAYLQSVYDPTAELHTELLDTKVFCAKVPLDHQTSQRHQTHSSQYIDLINDDIDELSRMAEDQANSKYRS
jgi:hypothetical protein